MFRRFCINFQKRRQVGHLCVWSAYYCCYIRLVIDTGKETGMNSYIWTFCQYKLMPHKKGSSMTWSEITPPICMGLPSNTGITCTKVPFGAIIHLAWEVTSVLTWCWIAQVPMNVCHSIGSLRQILLKSVFGSNLMTLEACMKYEWVQKYQSYILSLIQKTVTNQKYQMYFVAVY